MKARGIRRGEKHHWWPKSLSKHWVNENGKIGRIDPTGKVSTPSPNSLAVISDGHNVIPTRVNGRKDQPSPWDQTFEQEFDRPDGNFPALICSLEELVDKHRQTGKVNEDAYIFHEYSDQKISRLCECLVSLVVRSPKFRDSAIQVAESFRGQLPSNEKKGLAAANMKGIQSEMTRRFGTRGKYVVIFSENLEFIFGDGFYNNLNRNSAWDTSNARMLAPLTPHIAVLFVQPRAYMTQPRLMTLKAMDETVKAINETVQVYAKDCLFFKSQQPALIEGFTSNQHRVYKTGDPVSDFIERIPGVTRTGSEFGMFGMFGMANWDEMT